MCGICGISYSDHRTPERSTLEAMTQAIRHRGPDSDGFHVEPGVGLAMRRLAIVDVAGGDQPIPNEDESLWIVFNGESHNYPDLYADLVRRGHEFRTQSDTECILHLYEEYGDDCVHHLRGQAAIALWDGKKKKLLLARAGDTRNCRRILRRGAGCIRCLTGCGTRARAGRGRRTGRGRYAIRR